MHMFAASADAFGMQEWRAVLETSGRATRTFGMISRYRADGQGLGVVSPCVRLPAINAQLRAI
eukprot:12172992-Alexandrium_andersonii.AAC.1